MPPTERLLQPTFVESLFIFEDPALIPEHYDAWPMTPNFIGQWSIFGWSGGDTTMDFALDVTSEEQAEILASAKKEYFEDQIELYRHTLDVYILDPSGRQTRYYRGRTI